MTVIDTIEGRMVDTDDPYETLGFWWWVAIDPETRDWLALTCGDESYSNLVDAMEDENESYEIITAGWGTNKLDQKQHL